MKITVYTIKDCAFSKQEKEYLNTNKLVFEEKDLETNKDFLTEMLAISNNFAGTPVTRVEKDDGTISVLKGFTKEEFDTTFGFASPEPKAGPVAPPINDTPIPTTPVETVSPAPVPTPETPITTPVDVQTPNLGVSTDKNDPLKSVMDDLQAKAEPTTPPTPAEPPTPPTPLADEATPVPPAVEQPVVPPTDAPTIPDFPAK